MILSVLQCSFTSQSVVYCMYNFSVKNQRAFTALHIHSTYYRYLCTIKSCTVGKHFIPTVLTLCMWQIKKAELCPFVPAQAIYQMSSVYSLSSLLTLMKNASTTTDSQCIFSPSLSATDFNKTTLFMIYCFSVHLMFVRVCVYFHRLHGWER